MYYISNPSLYTPILSMDQLSYSIASGIPVPLTGVK